MGDPVTVLPPYDRDPLIVSMQPHARIAEVLPDADGPGETAYMIALGSAWPPDRRFGPFSSDRLKAGWQ